MLTSSLAHIVTSSDYFRHPTYTLLNSRPQPGQGAITVARVLLHPLRFLIASLTRRHILLSRISVQRDGTFRALVSILAHPKHFPPSPSGRRFPGRSFFGCVLNGFGYRAPHAREKHLG